MPDVPTDGPGIEAANVGRLGVGEGDEASRRRSLLLWAAVVGALLAAVVALILPAWFSYRALCAETNPAKIDSRIGALRSKGPVGTEFARRYLARRFGEERRFAAELIRRHQVLFHGLPVATMIEYLGPADTGTDDFITYLVNMKDDGADFIEIRLLNGTVEAIHLVEKRMPEPGAKEPQERRSPVEQIEERKSLKPPKAD